MTATTTNGVPENIPRYHMEYFAIAVSMAMIYIFVTAIVGILSALFLGFLVKNKEQVKLFFGALAVYFGIAALFEFSNFLLPKFREFIKRIYKRGLRGQIIKLILTLALYVGFYYSVLIFFVPKNFLKDTLNFLKWFGNAILSIPDQFL